MAHEFDKDKTTREDWGNIHKIYILIFKKKLKVLLQFF